ncbi:DUF3930 family protein [Ectobacillus antri]|uniref:DUF3930 family protein n=1 Tax=Ectobacillus antri TaxID=2486280 RepID=A0ABT6H1F8_9BACI|nr:DUF3930 family protein [Ectobacillus antri]MDG4656383.1 DUF3930 family protein [Ectobacillus antri]MDG5753058.1 DUF3930 family protein [Ectobacillus antri]
MKNVKYMQTEEKPLLTSFESEQFDTIMDKLISILLLFLTIVGIPYTVYLLLELILIYL